MMSMPLSSASLSSSSTRPARPPPNSVVKVSSKFWLMTVNASLEALARRLVDLPDRLVGRGDRIDEILALRGQEGVARFEVVELIDRHHVDRRPSVRSWCAGRRPSRRASSSAAVGAGALARRLPRPEQLGAPPRLPAPRRPAHRRPAAGWPAGPRARAAATSAATSSSVACTVSTQDAARCDRSDSAVARCDVELARPRRGPLRARRRASLMRASCASNCARSACDASSAVADAARADRRRCADRRRACASDVRDRRRAAPRGARRCAASSSRRAATRVLELARRLLEPLDLDRERRCALDQRGMRRLGLRGRCAWACIASRASNSRRCAAFS